MRGTSLSSGTNVGLVAFDEVAVEARAHSGGGFLSPGHVRGVTREGDVRARRVTGPARDRRPAVGEFEVRSPHQARHEHLLHAAIVLVPGHPRHGGVGRVHRPGGHPRVLRVFFRVLVQRALFLVGRGFPARIGFRFERSAQLAAHDRPMKAAFGACVGDALGGEHQIVVAQAQDFGCSCLVPHDPRHSVIGARERDVRLDAFARRVDVQARIGTTWTQHAGSRPAASRSHRSPGRVRLRRRPGA